MIVLGVDTAPKNLGLAVLDMGSERRVLHAETFKPAELSIKESDFIINGLIIKRIRELYKHFPIEAAGVESAALSAQYQMVSMGSVHGAILQNTIDKRTPFIYITPGKVKYLATGSGKATKREVMNAAKAFFSTKVRDSNIGDAMVIAVGAYQFWQLYNNRPVEHHFKEKFTKTVFYARSPKSKGRLPGILHRENEFFWVPKELKNV